MTRSSNNPWLGRFALLTATATLCLIAVGGLVTSHGAGMTVPDWPTSYGYNMFLFPIDQWVGGIKYEHTHRLAASAVGFLTTILAIWLWLKEERKGLRWMGIIAFFAVVLQGVLGGLRVTLYKDELGIFHAALAQGFLVLLCVIALFCSNWWKRRLRMKAETVSVCWHRGIVAITALIFMQLILGASMRHQHAGLAIPDFPLAYGEIWPRTDAAFVNLANSLRVDSRDFAPITANQILLHMSHRITAFTILLAVGTIAVLVVKRFGWQHLYSRTSAAWLALILAQACLGAWTVWSNKAADIATAHVVLGAISLVVGSLFSVVSLVDARKVRLVPSMNKLQGELSHAMANFSPSK